MGDEMYLLLWSTLIKLDVGDALDQEVQAAYPHQWIHKSWPYPSNGEVRYYLSTSRTPIAVAATNKVWVKKPRSYEQTEE